MLAILFIFILVVKEVMVQLRHIMFKPAVELTVVEMPDTVVELVAVVPIFVLIPIPFMLVSSSLVAVAVHIHTIPLIKLLVVLVEELAVSMVLTIGLHILLG